MKILLIATNEYLPLYILQCLQGLNVGIYILGTGEIPPVRLSRRCLGYISCDLNEILSFSEKLVDEINYYCKQNKIEIIVPTGIESTLFLSKMEKNINVKIFPVADLKILKKLNNKWEFAKILNKYSLPYPNTVLIEKVDNLKNLKIKFPIMAKPLEMHSGFGVNKIDSLNELYTYIQGKNKYNSLPLIVQEYVEGFGVDISLLAKDGKILAWAIQKSLPDGSIKFIKNVRILNLIKRIIAECSYSGVAHIDTIFDKKNRSIKILEFNPRFWGSILGSKMAGINFPYLGLLIAQNSPIATHLKYKEITYITTKNFLQNLWKNKLNKNNSLSLSVSDFWKMVYDPFPYIYLFLFEGKRKLKEVKNKR